MKHSEGIRRIVITLRAMGAIVLALGILAIDHQTQSGQFAMVVMTGIFAAPFFVVAWIVDGFVSREQREADALIAQMRRNAQLGRRALDRHPEA